MTRKTNNTKGLGNAIMKEKARQVDKMKDQAERLSAKMDIGLPSGKSVLEQSNLDDLIATIELRKEAWADETGEAEFVKGPTLVSYGRPDEVLAAETKAECRREYVSIPRRPLWEDGMDVDELARVEAEGFMGWRRTLAKEAQEEGLYLTPYERNLDFWRQLWRCVERSDLLVQIVDARDPDFYYCRDLARYVQQVGGGKKRLMLLCNKADFLTDAQRARWTEHFESKGVDHVYFSALHELRRQQRETVAQPRAHVVAKEGAAADEETTAAEKAAAAAWRPATEASASSSVFARAAAAGGEEDEDGHAAATSSTVPAKAVNAVHVPIPDSDSDDDLLGEKAAEQAPEQGGGEGKKATVAAEEQDDEEALGPQADDEFDGVVDSSTLLDELLARLPYISAGAADPSAPSAPRRRGTIGFVGFPNVGKSTVINALVGSVRVGMSRTPGKTKHIQTLELPAFGVTLCDCPGLVFPSVAASKAHLVVNNTVHIDTLIECFSPIALIVHRIGLEKILERYGCTAAVQEARRRSGDHVLDDTHAFLAALAVSRNHLLRDRVPDENWAARKVLKDYVSGAVLHVEDPPGYRKAQADALLAAGTSGEKADGLDEEPGEGEEDDDPDGSEEENFDDLDSFLKEARGGAGRKERTMTKKRMRALNKKLIKGAPVVEAADFVGVKSSAPHGVNGTNRTPARR